MRSTTTPAPELLSGTAPQPPAAADLKHECTCRRAGVASRWGIRHRLYGTSHDIVHRHMHKNRSAWHMQITATPAPRAYGIPGTSQRHMHKKRSAWPLQFRIMELATARPHGRATSRAGAYSERTSHQQTYPLIGISKPRPQKENDAIHGLKGTWTHCCTYSSIMQCGLS